VRLVDDWRSGVEVADGEVVLLENVRFNPVKKATMKRSPAPMRTLCDVFVMDAFGTAHRAQASTHGVARFAPVRPAPAPAGGGARGAGEGPGTAGAAHGRHRRRRQGVHQAEVLDTLADKVDQLIVGGGIANTFLAAAGYPVGKSLCEHDLLDEARRIAPRPTFPCPWTW
jgi:phosphoglycerate kinase